MTAPFHLGWFTNHMPPNWSGPWAGDAGERWHDGSFYQDLARDLERGGFDFVMLEDSSFLLDVYGGDFAGELRQMVRAPKHDPIPLVPMLSQVTRHLGIIATCSTSLHHPFLLARSMATLDHLTKGRVGWNIVTTAGQAAVENFGYASAPTHDEMYARAEDFISAAKALWASWEPDALVNDPESGVYVDPAKVHHTNFASPHFNIRGPLNTMPSPQGRPVILQAGGSPTGRTFAARHADAVVALPKGVDAMRDYKADIARLAAEAGRDPAEVKVFYMVTPLVGETKEDAEEQKRRRLADRQNRLEKRLLLMSGSGVDWAKMPLDAPLDPDDRSLFPEGANRSILETFMRVHAGKTLREAASEDETESVELIGSPDAVACQMAEVMEAVGGDGFLIYSGSGQLTRRYVGEIVDGLVPVLRRRGLVRDTYAHAHLRDNLMAF